MHFVSLLETHPGAGKSLKDSLSLTHQLCSFWQDPYWCTLLHYCVMNDAYIGCDLPDLDQHLQDVSSTCTECRFSPWVWVPLLIKQVWIVKIIRRIEIYETVFSTFGVGIVWLAKHILRYTSFRYSKVIRLCFFESDNWGPVLKFKDIQDVGASSFTDKYNTIMFVRIFCLLC